MKGYEDIINLPHHVSTKRQPMPMSDRAAQFSPFAALTGYDSAVKEVARLTEGRVELSEDELEVLNRSYRELVAGLREKEELRVRLVYFKQDERKAGGEYISVAGGVKKVDEALGVMTMEDGSRIPLGDIIALRREV